MYDKLEFIQSKYEELSLKVSDPAVIADQGKWQGYAKEIGEILQFRHIAVLSPEEHDAMIAFLSQLTHVIAVALMNTKDNTHLAEYTGDSFRDLTRIAVINEDLWPELFIMNKDYLIREIDAFVEEMLAFRKLVEEEDAEGMKQKMIISTERRKKFTKQ